MRPTDALNDLLMIGIHPELLHFFKGEGEVAESLLGKAAADIGITTLALTNRTTVSFNREATVPILLEAEPDRNDPDSGRSAPHKNPAWHP